MSETRRLVDTILVPHTAFQVGQRRMTQCMDYARAGAQEPVCMALIGESRTGKSRGIEAFMRDHPTVRLPEGIRMSVLYISVPSRPTVKALAELGLFHLGAADWERGTENAKTTRLVSLMRACGVMVLVLDEFHHFYDKSSHKVQHHVADWLKNLLADTKVALVVSGLPSLRSVVDQNEQLAGRFLSPVPMPRFNWLNDDHREEWQAILGAFTEGLGTQFDLPSLDGDELALRMFCATGGLMGYLTMTLRQAVWNAVDANRRVINLKDLEVAHGEAVWSKENVVGLPQPFDRSWTVEATPDLIARTQLVGAAVVHPERRSPGRRARTAVPAASSILTSR